MAAASAVRAEHDRQPVPAAGLRIRVHKTMAWRMDHANLGTIEDLLQLLEEFPAEVVEGVDAARVQPVAVQFGREQFAEASVGSEPAPDRVSCLRGEERDREHDRPFPPEHAPALAQRDLRIRDMLEYVGVDDEVE